MKEPTKEEIEYNNQKLKQLEPHLERIRRMNYKVEVKDLKIEPCLISNGIVIEITK